MASNNPWDYMSAHDVARFGDVIADPEEQWRWCSAIFLGGLPWMWQHAGGLKDIIYNRLSLKRGDRVLLIGESNEGTKFEEEIIARIGTEGELRSIDMIERVRNGVRDRIAGRGGKIGTFEYDFTYPDPTDHYDAIAVLQGVAHSDDWASTAQELLRVVKPGGAIVLAEINFGEPLIRKASEDLHLEYWLTKIMAGRRMNIADLPYVPMEELVAAFEGLWAENGSFTWKGADVLWGYKPS